MSTIEKNVPGARELADLVREKEEELAHLRSRLAEWERTYDATPKRDVLFSTTSAPTKYGLIWSALTPNLRRSLRRAA